MEPTRPVIASIDLGTNTVSQLLSVTSVHTRSPTSLCDQCLLLIVEVDAVAGVITRFVAHEERLPRIGQGVDAGQLLQVDAVDRVRAVLREYAQLIEAAAATHVVMTATSAVRDARNGAEFCDQVRAEFPRWQVRVLSGTDEARLAHRGALCCLPPLCVDEPADAVVVVDIGGGSTELSVSRDAATSTNEQPLTQCSIQAGCIRFSERFRADFAAAESALTTQLASVGENVRAACTGRLRLVGVAGVVLTIAAKQASGAIEQWRARLFSR